jgi:hypothetical protein
MRPAAKHNLKAIPTARSCAADRLRETSRPGSDPEGGDLIRRMV